MTTGKKEKTTPDQREEGMEEKERGQWNTYRKKQKERGKKSMTKRETYRNIVRQTATETDSEGARDKKKASERQIQIKKIILSIIMSAFQKALTFF